MPRCTCPIVPFRDDPYYHCDYCDQVMEERAERADHEARESDLDFAFDRLCEELDGR